MFLNEYEIEQRRTIIRVSKRSTSLEQARRELKRHGIDLKAHPGLNRRLTVKVARNKTVIDSSRSRDRVFAQSVEKNIRKAADKQQGRNTEKSRQKETAKQYDRFDSIRKNRERNTQLQAREMFNTKGMSKKL